MKKTIVVLLSVIITSNAFCNLLLVRNGRPHYSIVVPSNPSKEEFRSADFLQRYIQKVSGAVLPIITEKSETTESEIVIGNTSRISQSELMSGRPEIDEFFITTRGKKLYVNGGERGLFYAIVTILENYLGCRKYSPDFEFTPKLTTIDIADINIHDKSVNTYRVVYGNFTANKEYKDWNRLNEIDDFFGDGYYSHTFWRLVPPNQYFNSKPEYFALIDGVRSPKQLCLSNPDVFDLTIKTLEAEMAKQPDRKIWSVSQNDNRGYCTCDECSRVIKEEGSPSGPILRFVNKVAAHFPDKIISTLAYTYSRRPPAKTRPAANVQIMLCTAEVNRSLPIESDTSNAGFIRDMKAWHQLTNKLYLWDYTVNFANNISPFPNLRTLQANIQFFVKNGIREQFQQTNAEAGFEFAELKSYLISRLLWNPYVKTDSVLVDFFKGYYGKAATWIRDYAYQMERESRKSPEPLSNFGSPFWHSGSFLSKQNIDYYKACFDSAFNAVKGDSVMTAHVSIAYLPLQYAMFEIGKSEPMGDRGWFLNVNGQFSPRQDIKAELDRFYHNCQKYKIKKLNEAGLSPQDYFMANIRYLVPQTSRNLAYKKKIVAIPQPNADYSLGNLELLTNGFLGSSTITSQWIGWQGTDFELLLDLEKVEHPSEICISSLNLPGSWAFYPNKIVCMVSENGQNYRSIGQFEIDNHDRIGELTHNFCISMPPGNVRYVKFKVDCTKRLPDWMVMDGDKSWTFIDEIVVRP